MGFFSSIGDIFSKVAPIASSVSSIAGQPWVSAAIEGGASLLGGRAANAASAQQARQMMEFQQYNSDTSYQRAVKDLRAAGLNPALAYSQGGASTPSGSQAPQNDVVTPAVSTSLQARRLAADLENIQADASQKRALTLKTQHEARTAKVLADVTEKVGAPSSLLTAGAGLVGGLGARAIGGVSSARQAAREFASRHSHRLAQIGEIASRNAARLKTRVHEKFDSDGVLRSFSRMFHK